MKLIEIWKNKKSIIEGILNNTFKKEHIEIIAKERFDICKQCTKRDDFGSTCMVKGTQPCCAECGCSLKLKTRSLSSSCPLDKWKALVTEEEESVIENSLKNI